MTKKDYELIASVLKQAILFCDDTSNQDDDILLLETLSKRFADTLASKNPRFNREKFLKACGVEVENERIKTCVNCWAITKTSLKNWHCANCGVDN